MQFMISMKSTDQGYPERQTEQTQKGERPCSRSPCRHNQAALFFAIKSSNGFVVCLKRSA